MSTFDATFPALGLIARPSPARDVAPLPAARFRQGVATTPDDLGLTYRVYGEQGPFLVCTNGLGVSTFFWETFAAAFADRYRVVIWDFVGHGRSSDPVDPKRASIGSFADDQATVMDAVGAEQAVLLGHSLGAQVNFEFYRRRADRVRALVPTLGTYGRGVETFFGAPFFSLRLAAVARKVLPRVNRFLPLALDPLVRTSLIERAARWTGMVDWATPPMADYFKHLVRLDYRVFAELLGDIQRHDAWDLLATIQVPTLVVGADRDLFVPLKVARKMAGAIPGSELAILPKGTHAALFEQAELFHSIVARFLKQRVFRP